VLPIPLFFQTNIAEARVRALLICPIPLEFTGCRSAFGLRDDEPVAGCRTARGTSAGIELLAVESGPAKARAAAATVAAIYSFKPDLVLDTGTCGALDGDLILDAVVVATGCLEYDISGNGLPHRIIPEMNLPSGLEIVPRRESQKLVHALIGMGKDQGLHVRPGLQASGELFIQSTQVRESLFAVSGALACNWETAGVFIGSLRSRIPPLSFRIVSDLGDEDALRDFRRNARRSSQVLYRFLREVFEAGWIASLMDQWKAIPRSQRDRLPQKVLP
jgi:adenosylhomocysteine nucleosidase